MHQSNPVNWVTSARFEIIGIEDLKEHEEVDSNLLRTVMRKVKAEGVIRKPIAVDSRTLVVIDGAHRLNALKLLQCDRVPACMVDYQSDDILLYSTSGDAIKKEDVINTALAGKRFPPKTTRHMVKLADGRIKHISWLEKGVRIPISTLGRRR
jgi:L-serine kinase (ADP)